MTEPMPKSVTTQGNGKVNRARHDNFAVGRPFIRVLWCSAGGGQTQGILSGIAGTKHQKYETLLGADRRQSLRVRAIKRREKNKKRKAFSEAFSQGSCGKIQGKKTKRETAFSQGSRDEAEGGTTKKRTIRAIRATRTIRTIRRPYQGFVCRSSGFVSGNTDRNPAEPHTR